MCRSRAKTRVKWGRQLVLCPGSVIHLILVLALFSSIPGPYPLDTRSILLVVTTKIVSRHCQMSLGGKNRKGQVEAFRTASTYQYSKQKQHHIPKISATIKDLSSAMSYVCISVLIYPHSTCLFGLWRQVNLGEWKQFHVNLIMWWLLLWLLFQLWFLCWSKSTDPLHLLGSYWPGACFLLYAC